ncbi:MAG: ABC transporter substrate-binding protein, partial [Chitinophagaceae bacterium]
MKRNMPFKNLYRYFVLLLSGGIGIAGCYNKQSSEKNIFHYNEFSGIPTLDPAFAKSQAPMWPAHQLFNTLVEIDSNLHIVPSLAKSWDISADRTMYTF